jgi:hypothetical protein
MASKKPIPPELSEVVVAGGLFITVIILIIDN